MANLERREAIKATPEKRIDDHLTIISKIAKRNNVDIGPIIDSFRQKIVGENKNNFDPAN